MLASLWRKTDTAASRDDSPSTDRDTNHPTDRRRGGLTRHLARIGATKILGVIVTVKRTQLTIAIVGSGAIL